MNDNIIICNGDSWTWGGEIVDPDLFLKYPDRSVFQIDLEVENDSYRNPKTWPSQLSKKMNTRVINLSRVADDNNSILNRTINFVYQGLRNKRFTADQLLLIIGWSTPERREFYYRNPINASDNFSYRLSPHGVGFPKDSDLYKFWKLYLKNFWNPEEYIIRNLITMLSFENFCKENKIKFLHFNSFYQKDSGDIYTGWQDINMLEELKALDDSMLGYNVFTDSAFGSVRQSSMDNFSNLWKEIDPIRHYCKDQNPNSFKSFIQNSKISEPFIGLHPSPAGHEVWADELIRYMTSYKLI